MNTKLLSVILFATSAACSSNIVTVPLEVGPRTEMALGKLEIKENVEGGDHRVELDVSNLAAPAAVVRDASNYVVWVRPLKEDPSIPRNVGELRVGSDSTAELSTVSPFRDFELFVTAEKSKKATAPTGERVLSARVVNLNKKR